LSVTVTFFHLRYIDDFHWFKWAVAFSATKSEFSYYIDNYCSGVYAPVPDSVNNVVLLVVLYDKYEIIV
jgi:hypothetical protein